MAHFLIADDEVNVRASIRLLLELQNHTYCEASNIVEIISTIKKSEQEENSFDLILLDYDFGGATGIDAINLIKRHIGEEYCEHRFIIITGSCRAGLAGEFASLGAIGHLIKPVRQEQFWVTLEAGLTRREMYVDYAKDWESALDILVDSGVIEDIEELNNISGKYNALSEIHKSLVSDLEKAGEKEQNILRAYTQANESLSISSDSFESIYSIISGSGYTKPFIEDIRDVFQRDRLRFLILKSYLIRIKADQYAYRIRQLNTTGLKHYEYRIGASFRLYFRYENDSKMVFERFGNKNIQPQIIHNLESSEQLDISKMDLVVN